MKLIKAGSVWLRIKLLFELQELAYHFVFSANNWCVSKGAKEIIDERGIACNKSSDKKKLKEIINVSKKRKKGLQ